MATYSVRCRHTACRHRRVTTTHPDDYKVVPRCPACGQRKGWRIEQRGYNKRGLCNCGGPVGRDGPIPHRTTHPMCEQHPQGYANQMRRSGADEADIAFELGGRKMGETDDCPF